MSLYCNNIVDWRNKVKDKREANKKVHFRIKQTVERTVRLCMAMLSQALKCSEEKKILLPIFS